MLGHGLSQAPSERRKSLSQDCLERVVAANRTMFFFRKGDHVGFPFSEITGRDSNRTPSSLASCPNRGQEQLRNPMVDNYQIKCRRKMFSWSCINYEELA